MKLLIALMLFTGFNLALAAETTAETTPETTTEKSNEQPPVDHSSIFQHTQHQTEAPDIEKMNQAEVVSVVNTRGYTYIEVPKEDKTVWLAVPTTEVEAGDTVHYDNGPVVYNHHSRTLDRTFDTVIFLLSVVVSGDK